jgi:hypothetical protein
MSMIPKTSPAIADFVKPYRLHCTIARTIAMMPVRSYSGHPRQLKGDEWCPCLLL